MLFDVLLFEMWEGEREGEENVPVSVLVLDDFHGGSSHIVNILDCMCLNIFLLDNTFHYIRCVES